MENKRNKLRSLIKQVQSSTEEILSRRQSNNSQITPHSSSINSIVSAFGVSSCSSSSSAAGTSNTYSNNKLSSSSSSSSVTQLDLASAIEYNHYLTNSYLEERNSRELSTYDQIISECDQTESGIAQCEQAIIDEIGKEFFLNSIKLGESDDDDDDEYDAQEEEDETTDEDVDNKQSSPINDNICKQSESIIPPCDEAKQQQKQIEPLSETKSDDLDSDHVSSSINNAITEDQSTAINYITVNNQNDSFLSQSKIYEICVLSKLPDFSATLGSNNNDNNDDDDVDGTKKCDEFLRYLDEEKRKLEKQVTIVSKRLSNMILENDKQFSTELKRVRAIDVDLQNAIDVCGNGRNSLFLSRRDFTSTSLSIVENYSRREAIVDMIGSLQRIRKIRSTIDHIQTLLELEKNFPSAIRLYHETSDTLERMATDYTCVREMKAKLVQMLLLAEEQMDQTMSRMPTTFCPQTYQQLANAYKQIGKSENSIHQLLMHFTNTIHDKAFSIVLGYVELFADIGTTTTTSTPIKNSAMRRSSASTPTTSATTGVGATSSSAANLNRKPFTELCQYLKAESFLSCLTDLCRAMWDVMQNYFRVTRFYCSSDRQRTSGLAEADFQFATTKLQYGTLTVWSDIQHKIRALISSVKFVELHQNGQNVTLASTRPSAPVHSLSEDSANRIGDSISNTDIAQDQLLFTFEEFIKILTVCEKMIEIGNEFCAMSEQSANNVDRTGSVTIELQNTLYQQTRAYFQSYHQVSMAELRIFLENETWTRCPVEACDDFALMANLQEFAFIKNRLMKLGQKSNKTEQTNRNNNNNNNQTTIKSTKSSSSSSSFLLSPLNKSKNFFATYFREEEEEEEEYGDDVDYDAIGEDILQDAVTSITPPKKITANRSPFDDILSFAINQQTYDVDDDDALIIGDEDATNANGNATAEIVTTNTALNVVRLTGRYMHIMFLLRPISHDVIQALMELFDYYFFTVYRFFAIDTLQTAWLSATLSGVTGSAALTIDSLVPQPAQQPSGVSNGTSSTNRHFAQISSELRSFIRRINDTLILNESTTTTTTNTANNALINNNNNDNNRSSNLVEMSSLNSSRTTTPNTSPKRLIKYPSPMLPDYVPIYESGCLYALPERIMAIESLIFIARQFYNLCPFLLDILRDEQSATEQSGPLIEGNRKCVEEGFKLLQFYHDEMYLSVESLLQQCLFAVATKLLPYETIIADMAATKWDLREIPSIHSRYVDSFVQHIIAFNDRYIELLKIYDLTFLLPQCRTAASAAAGSEISSIIGAKLTQTNDSSSSGETSTTNEDALSLPLLKLDTLSKRINLHLWECVIRISNRCFVEGFASARKCTQEGRALMQLDYQQFLSHMEKLITAYFANSATTTTSSSSSSSSSSRNDSGTRQAKALLTAEKEFVEEFVKAYYLTEPIFLDWIKQRQDYTNKQVLSLVNCIAGDNRKLKSSLLAALDANAINHNHNNNNNKSNNLDTSNNNSTLNNSSISLT